MDMWAVATWLWDFQIVTLLPIVVVILVLVYLYRILNATGTGLGNWLASRFRRVRK